MTFDELSPAVVFEAAAAERKSGAEVIFDPGQRSPAFGSKRRAELDSILRFATVLTLTEDELEFIAPGVTPEEGAHRLLERFGGSSSGALDWVVVKQGPEGAFVAGEFDSIFQEVFEIELADSVGCSDLFVAVLYLGRMCHCGAQSTLRIACATGAATAESRGAGRNVGTLSPTRELVERKYGPKEMIALFSALAT